MRLIILTILFTLFLIPVYATCFKVCDYSDFVDAKAVSVVGNIAYVADYWDFKTLDISNPAEPLLLDTVWTSLYSTSIAVVDNYAYITWLNEGEVGGLVIFNVTNPNYNLMSDIFSTPGEAHAVAVSGNTAYVADGSAGMQIIDVTDHSNPVLLHSYDTPGNPRDIQVVNNIAYIAEGLSGLQIVDVSDPVNPQL
ncbi:MAG TPA: hypothetical protein PKK33_01655, partial [Candidatus Cloacimonadota bacterium]|nr:hypothetical protein [Candidatus Cloacimonadota bacterium]